MESSQWSHVKAMLVTSVPVAKCPTEAVEGRKGLFCLTGSEGFYFSIAAARAWQWVREVVHEEKQSLKVGMGLRVGLSLSEDH